MKRPSASAELGIELSKISAALTVMKELLDELPDTKIKKALQRLCAEGEQAYERAFERLQQVREHASQI